MKNTRKITTITCVAAVAKPWPTRPTVVQNGVAGGGGAGVAAGGGGLALPVCATASISAAAFFTSAIGLDGVRAACLTEVAIAFAATGSWSHSRRKSSV